MKKILVYGLTQTKGGVESFLMNYYRNFDKDKVQLDFISNTETAAYEDEVKALGGQVYKVCSKKKNPFKFKSDLEMIFKEHPNEYDVMWVNSCSLANIDYLKAAKKYGIKKRIIHSHSASNMFGKFKGALHKFNKSRITSYANCFWACSYSAAKWFYNDEILKSEQFKLIKNAVDIRDFKYDKQVRNKYRKELGIDDKFVLGNIGRFNYEKNHNFLIDIFSEIYKENKNTVLLLIGEGDLEKEVKDKVEKLQLNDGVIFLGTRSDVNKLIQAIDVFLMPSRFEGLPVSAIEAQASGVKCILSSNITEEVRVTDLVQFERIDQNDSVVQWKNKILTYKDGYDRRDTTKEIFESGFEIKSATKMLQDIFIDIN